MNITKPITLLQTIKYRKMKWKRDEIMKHILIDTYRKIYKQSEPKLDINCVLNKPNIFKDNWFIYYYIDIDMYNNIIQSQIKKYKLDHSNEKTLKMNINLGWSPTNNKKSQLK